MPAPRSESQVSINKQRDNELDVSDLTAADLVDLQNDEHTTHAAGQVCSEAIADVASEATTRNESAAGASPASATDVTTEAIASERATRTRVSAMEVDLAVTTRSTDSTMPVPTQQLAPVVSRDEGAAKGLIVALAHIRLVHFSLLAICCVAFYFFWISRTATRGVVRELRAFERLLEKSDRDPCAMVAVAAEDLLLHADHQLASSLRPILTEPDVITTEFLATARSCVVKREESLTLLALPLKEILTGRVTVRVVANVKSDRAAFKAETTDVTGMAQAGPLLATKIDGVFLDVHDRENPGLLVAYSKVFPGRPTRNPETALPLSVPFVMKLPVEVREESRVLGVGAFAEDYPLLVREFDELTDTAPALQDEYEARGARPLTGESFDVLGTKFHGEHVGAVAPVAVIVIMLYLLAHVLELRRIGPTSEPTLAQGIQNELRQGPNPWIPALSGWIGRGAMLALVVILPTLCVGATLYWFLERSAWEAAIGSLVPAVLGIAVDAILHWRRFRARSASAAPNPAEPGPGSLREERG